jgi:opacity protein-like surface antigen
MRLKTVLLASAAMVVGLATAEAAQAGSLYGTFSGGLNWSDDIGPTGGPTTNIDLNSETGFVVAVALGWHLDDMITPGLRVELEGAYRHNNASGSFTFSGTSSLGNDLVTWSVMGNVWYDFSLGHSLRPYFGGGIGWASNKVVPELCPCGTVESEGFAWQLGAGLNVAVSEHASIGLGYRYMDSGDEPTMPFGANLGSMTHQSVLFNINYDLN